MEAVTSIERGRPVAVMHLGRVSYEHAWELQKKLQRELIDRRTGQTLILCEHEPVITFGKSSKPHNLLASAETLRENGVTRYEVERGGDVTYHGPGQVVAYPILDLNNFKRDVGWYMRTLEEVLIRTLARFGVEGRRIPGRTGVWTEAGDGGSVSGRKIASIGVRISRWCTMHGFALNVFDCTEGFSLINPCGFTDIHMTSIEQELCRSGRLFEDREKVWNNAVDLIESTFDEVFNQEGANCHAAYR